MRIRFAFWIFINLFRLPVLKLFAVFKLKSPIIQLVSPKTTIEIKKGGFIHFLGRIHTENNVLISAANGRLSIGKRVYINRNSMIVCRDRICIGDNSTIGPNVVIYDHDHNMTSSGKITSKPITIEDNVWIGAGAIILKGVRIGSNSVIAAGTIVTKDVPPHSIVYNRIVYEIRKVNTTDETRSNYYNE